MTKLRLLNLEPLKFAPVTRARIKEFGDVTEGPITRKQLLKRIGDYEILWIRLGHRIDAEVIKSARKLRCIVSPTTGLDHIDLDACRRRGIEVLSLKGEIDFLRSVTGTAEHALGLALALLRNTVAANAAVGRGIWRRDGFIGRQTSDLTLGIVGYGRLGQHMAKIGAPLFKRILAHDRGPQAPAAKVEHVSAERLLEESDVVTLHLPLSADTENWLDDKRIKRMRKGSYLINTARGGIVDERALLAALKLGHLAGAAMDVLAKEQTRGFNPKKDPLVVYAKSQPHRVIVTPHIGGATVQSMTATELFMAKKLKENFLKGGVK